MKLPELPALPLPRYDDDTGGCWMTAPDEAFTADQMRSYALQCMEMMREECAKAIEALRADHCAGTKLSHDKNDWCRPEGDDGCEFVAAWNDAIAAIREKTP